MKPEKKTIFDKKNLTVAVVGMRMVQEDVDFSVSPLVFMKTQWRWCV